MKFSIKTGFSFGLTSGIITTLGLMVGLNSVTHSRLAVIGGIITIAVADALSDALGIHVSQESTNHATESIWEATTATFTSKLFFALTFIIPVLLFQLSTAIAVSIIYGLSLLTILSYFIAKKRNKEQLNAILEHLIIAVVVIIATHYIGNWISTVFI